MSRSKKAVVLSDREIAVNLYREMSLLKSVDRDRFINVFMGMNSHPDGPMSDIEIKGIVDRLSRSHTFIKGNKLYALEKDGNLNLEKIVKILAGRSVFLNLAYDGVLYEEIEFNCDGDGSIRRADGSVVRILLVDLAKLIVREVGLNQNTVTYQDWKVSRDKHPEVTRNRLNLRDYLDMYCS